MKLFKSKYFLLFLGSALFLAIVCVNAFQTRSISDLAQSTSEKLNDKYTELKSASDKAKNEVFDDLPNLFETSHIGIYIYKKKIKRII